MEYKKPEYCIKCGLCSKYKDCFQNLKVKDIGYSRSNIYCLKKNILFMDYKRNKKWKNINIKMPL